MMLRAARTVVFFGVVLQLVGFVRLLFVAAYFGAGPVLDAYYLAQIIPTFINGMSAGTLQTGFVPGYMGAKARQDEAGARELRNVTLTWTLTLIVGSAALVYLWWPTIVGFFWGNIDPVSNQALRSSFALLIWIAPMTGACDAMCLVLNAEGRFAAAAAAPSLNAVVSAAVLILWPDRGTGALTWSLFLGLGAQFVLVACAFGQAGLRWAPTFALPGSLPRTLTIIALPVLITTALGNFVPAFVQFIASRAGSGAVSAMGYAGRLHNSIVQTITMSVSVVLLPHFARLMAERRHDELRLTLERVFCATLLFFLATVVVVAVSGRTAIELLLQRGRFTHDTAELVASIWLALSVGLMGMTWGIFLARHFQAQQRPWVTAFSSVLSVILNITLASLLLPVAGVMGIALANALSYTGVMLMFHILVTRSLGPILSAGTRTFVLRAVAVNATAYGVALAWSTVLSEAPPVAVLAGQLLVVAAANLLVVGVAPLSVPVAALWRR